MQTADQKKINGELRKLGFGSLDDPGLIPAIAYYIRDHAQFRGQLFSVLPEKRHLAYEALRPHLRFTPKPLSVYEEEMKTMAEQQQWGQWNPKTHQIEPFKVGEVGEKLDKVATKAIDEREMKCLYLTCAKCTKIADFMAPTRKEAEAEARSAGWLANDGKSYCKKHAKLYVN